MIQRGNRASFALEAVGESHLRDLDRDVAIEARIVGAPDHAHPALAQLFENPVMRDGRAFEAALIEIRRRLGWLRLAGFFVLADPFNFS